MHVVCTDCCTGSHSMASTAPWSNPTPLIGQHRARYFAFLPRPVFVDHPSNHVSAADVTCTSQRHRATETHAKIRGVAVQVVLLRGTDLKPTASKGSPEGARDSEACQCFIELRVLGRSYVSPIAPQGCSPEWHWTFWVPVDDVPTAADYASLRFTAINFMARKQPQVQLQAHSAPLPAQSSDSCSAFCTHLAIYTTLSLRSGKKLRSGTKRPGLRSCCSTPPFALVKGQ